MRYVSTRGGAATRDFAGVLLAGLAEDGGLFVPERWPVLTPPEWRELRRLPYPALAARVVGLFAGDVIDAATMEDMCAQAYGSAFAHEAVAPLVQLEHGLFALELFHGPTLAFKDMALQLLGKLFAHVLARDGKRVTIVGATSGDTGSAAIAACRDRPAIDIVILHPQGRTSEVQRRQMTTVLAPNVANLAVDGNFDDCQALVKGMFADARLRDEVSLSAVNSINWARIAAQIAYYVYAALALGAPDRPVSFAVPTGNFGNVLAAWRCPPPPGGPRRRCSAGSRSTTGRPLPPCAGCTRRATRPTRTRRSASRPHGVFARPACRWSQSRPHTLPSSPTRCGRRPVRRPPCRPLSPP